MMQCTTLPEDWLLVESIFRQMEGIFQSDVHKRGSLICNHKGFHIIVLLALVDGDYKFLWVDVVAAVSTSDA